MDSVYGPTFFLRVPGHAVGTDEMCFLAVDGACPRAGYRRTAVSQAEFFRSEPLTMSTLDIVRMQSIGFKVPMVSEARRGPERDG